MTFSVKQSAFYDTSSRNLACNMRIQFILPLFKLPLSVYCGKQ